MHVLAAAFAAPASRHFWRTSFVRVGCRRSFSTSSKVAMLQSSLFCCSCTHASNLPRLLAVGIIRLNKGSISGCNQLLAVSCKTTYEAPCRLMQRARVESPFDTSSNFVYFDLTVFLSHPKPPRALLLSLGPTQSHGDPHRDGRLLRWQVHD